MSVNDRMTAMSKEDIEAWEKVFGLKKEKGVTMYQIFRPIILENGDKAWILDSQSSNSEYAQASLNITKEIYPNSEIRIAKNFSL